MAARTSPWTWFDDAVDAAAARAGRQFLAAAEPASTPVPTPPAAHAGGGPDEVGEVAGYLAVDATMAIDLADLVDAAAARHPAIDDWGAADPAPGDLGPGPGLDTDAGTALAELSGALGQQGPDALGTEVSLASWAPALGLAPPTTVDPWDPTPDAADAPDGVRLRDALDDAIDHALDDPVDGPLDGAVAHQLVVDRRVPPDPVDAADPGPGVDPALDDLTDLAATGPVWRGGAAEGAPAGDDLASDPPAPPDPTPDLHPPAPPLLDPALPDPSLLDPPLLDPPLLDPPLLDAPLLPDPTDGP
ncbi:MAG TPA: hypothetical protein VK866_11320, partial [Acidimicrobiales bacterium]|nr:hypothetical protein [Acidimicrobiales bacterium]